MSLQDQCGIVLAHICMCISKTNVELFLSMYVCVLAKQFGIAMAHICMCISKTNVECCCGTLAHFFFTCGIA